MPKILLICYVSAETGIGHLSRLLALGDYLLKENKVIPELLIFGDLVKKKDLKYFKVHNFSFYADFHEIINNLIYTFKFELLIFDIFENNKIKNIRQLLLKIKSHNIPIIGIDCLKDHCDTLKLIWMPTFFDHSDNIKCKKIIKSGWDKYLIQKRYKNKQWLSGNKVLVLTGGSDITKLSDTWPLLIDKNLGKNSEVHWVKGPLANKFMLPNDLRLKWIIHDSPEQLDEIILNCNYAITVFGISFFEVIQYGIPTVVFSPYKNKDEMELQALKKLEVAVVAKNYHTAIDELIYLMNNNNAALKYSNNSINKMSINGVKKFAFEIYNLININ